MSGPFGFARRLPWPHSASTPPTASSAAPPTAPGPGEAEALARQGLPAWVEHQLALPAEEPAVEDRLAAIRLPIRYAADRGRAGRRWRRTGR